MISTKEKTNGQTDKTKLNKIGKKVNIYTMNCVKKNLMSPIEENINSNEKLKPNLNNINEITNNNNNNIKLNLKNCWLLLFQYFLFYLKNYYLPLYS